MKRPLLSAVVALVACSGCATGVTGKPVDVAGTSARVGGAVITSTGQQVEFWAEYGLTSAYGSSSEHYTTTLEPGKPNAVERELTGLSRSTTYHYRICARDSEQSGGPRCGSDETLTTVNVDCGDVLTHDLVLSGSLACHDLHTPGLVVGADGVDLDLNGHEIRGPLISLHPESEPAVVNDGHDDFSLHGGSLRRWGWGLRAINASFNRVRDLDVSAWAGIDMYGDANTIRRYRLVEVGRGGYALSAGGDHLVVTDSSGQVWSVFGNHARIARATISGIFESEACLLIGGNGNRVVDSVMSGCPNGNLVVRFGSGNALIRNRVNGAIQGPFEPTNPDGIRVEPFTAETVIRDNVAESNGDDGIEVLASNALVEGNRADGNGDFGIDAAAGVTDRGGNLATDNGNPLQCRNVFCQ